VAKRLVSRLRRNEIDPLLGARLRHILSPAGRMLASRGRQLDHCAGTPYCIAVAYQAENIRVVINENSCPKETGFVNPNTVVAR